MGGKLGKVTALVVAVAVWLLMSCSDSPGLPYSLSLVASSLPHPSGLHRATHRCMRLVLWWSWVQSVVSFHQQHKHHQAFSPCKSQRLEASEIEKQACLHLFWASFPLSFSSCPHSGLLEPTDSSPQLLEQRDRSPWSMWSGPHANTPDSFCGARWNHRLQFWKHQTIHYFLHWWNCDFLQNNLYVVIENSLTLWRLLKPFLAQLFVTSAHLSPFHPAPPDRNSPFLDMTNTAGDLQL